MVTPDGLGVAGGANVGVMVGVAVTVAVGASVVVAVGGSGVSDGRKKLKGDEPDRQKYQS